MLGYNFIKYIYNRGGAGVGDFYKYHPQIISGQRIFINTIPRPSLKFTPYPRTIRDGFSWALVRREKLSSLIGKLYILNLHLCSERISVLSSVRAEKDEKANTEKSPGGPSSMSISRPHQPNDSAGGYASLQGLLHNHCSCQLQLS